jgi:homoserine kinase type II
MLARLHLAGAGYPPTRENTLGPAGWPALLAGSLAGADTVQKGLSAELSAMLAQILAAWPKNLPHGHIHADLFPDNVFFLDGAVSGVIDFLFAATDYYAYDVAVCLNAWCFELDHQFNATKARALLQGYRSVRPLLPAEEVAMPVLCQGAAMRFMLTRLHDWLHPSHDALVTRKDPLEYWRKLRFHVAIRDFHDYGI